MDELRAELTCADSTIRKEAYIMSGALGLVVAVVSFGMFGRIWRKTFDATTVMYSED